MTNLTLSEGREKKCCRSGTELTRQVSGDSFAPYSPHGYVEKYLRYYGCNA